MYWKSLQILALLLVSFSLTVVKAETDRKNSSKPDHEACVNLGIDQAYLIDDPNERLLQFNELFPDSIPFEKASDKFLQVYQEKFESYQKKNKNKQYGTMIAEFRALIEAVNSTSHTEQAELFQYIKNRFLLFVFDKMPAGDPINAEVKGVIISALHSFMPVIARAQNLKIRSKAATVVDGKKISKSYAVLGSSDPIKKNYIEASDKEIRILPSRLFTKLTSDSLESSRIEFVDPFHRFDQILESEFPALNRFIKFVRSEENSLFNGGISRHQNNGNSSVNMHALIMHPAAKEYLQFYLDSPALEKQQTSFVRYLAAGNPLRVARMNENRPPIGLDDIRRFNREFKLHTSGLLVGKADFEEVKGSVFSVGSSGIGALSLYGESKHDSLLIKDKNTTLTSVFLPNQLKPYSKYKKLLSELKPGDALAKKFIQTEMLLFFSRYLDVIEFYLSRQKLYGPDIAPIAQKTLKEIEQGNFEGPHMKELQRVIAELPEADMKKLTLRGIRESDLAFFWPDQKLDMSNKSCELCRRDYSKNTSETVRHLLFNEGGSLLLRKELQRNLTGRLAVHEALRTLEKLGYEWQDVGDDNLGFDVAVKSPEGKVYWVEVKGSVSGRPTYSSNELDFARQHPFNSINIEVHFKPDQTDVRIFGSHELRWE